MYTRNKDPREIFLRDMAKKLTEGTENEEFFNMSQEIEEFMKEKEGIDSQCGLLFNHCISYSRN